MFFFPKCYVAGRVSTCSRWTTDSRVPNVQVDRLAGGKLCENVWCSEVHANAVAVRLLLLECKVWHFKRLSKCSWRNFVFRSVLESRPSGWLVFLYTIGVDHANVTALYCSFHHCHGCNEICLDLGDLGLYSKTHRRSKPHLKSTSIGPAW